MRQAIRAAAARGISKRSPSSAARGTPPRSPSLAPRRRRRAAERAAARQGRGDLDPVDELAPLLAQRLWRGRRLARLVRAPLDRARSPRDPLGVAGGAAAAARRTRRLSSANVIEAVRLGEALAALRGLPMPGLAETARGDAHVLCNGDEAPMHLIRERLEIGEHLGAVPPETPAVPLQRDLAAAQRRLRLPAERRDQAARSRPAQ